jgi:chorismate dehydratase
VPEVSKNLLGVPEASYVRPLLHDLPGSSADLEILVDLPSQLAIKLQQRTGSLRCAFLSPIDYARHGSDYLIVPGIGVSSSSGTETVKLYVNPDVRNIATMAVDIRVTSEIILAKIVLAEKFPNDDAGKKGLQFIPMLPNRDEMLRKADAALIVDFHPHQTTAAEPFSLDLVDEWNDLTGLPYVHGVWVGHDEPEAEGVVPGLVRSRDRGVSNLGETVDALSAARGLSRAVVQEYFSNFTYGFGEEEQEGFSEFIRYAYFHGVLPDVPELNFFELETPPPESVN